MHINLFAGKKIDREELIRDCKESDSLLTSFYEVGYLDDDYDVLEFILGRDTDYVYSLSVYLNRDAIIRVERVKFQTMCGGWRSKYERLKRFPSKMADEEQVAKECVMANIV